MNTNYSTSEHIWSEITALFQLLEINIPLNEFEAVIEIASEKIEKDLNAYVANDPAAHGSKELVLRSYKCFQAVLLYRIANALLGINNSLEYQIYARKISEHARVISRVEIHPAAEIGVPFVIDHGNGTVIGETTKIGDNCYILNNVTLGGRRVSNNPNSKRHPTIGNNVQIAASAAVYGPVTVGNDCFIGPSCTVTENLPDGSKLTVTYRMQQLSLKSSQIEIFSVVPEMQKEQLILQGKHLNAANLNFTIKGENENEKSLKIQASSEGRAILRFKKEYVLLRKKILTVRKENVALFSLMLSPTIFL